MNLDLVEELRHLRRENAELREEIHRLRASLAKAEEEATHLEMDLEDAEDELDHTLIDNEHLRRQIAGHCERIARQSELLARHAEKPNDLKEELR